MESDGIDIAGIKFLSLVGTADWVAEHQGANVPTLFLDIVSLLQVAYSYSTDGRTQLADEKSAAQVGYLSVPDAAISNSYKMALPGVFAGKATETLTVSMKQLPGLPSYQSWDTHSATSGTRSTMREKIRQMKSSYMARITNSKISAEGKFVDSDNAHDERRLRGGWQRLPVNFLRWID
jgi:hypothetical protein